MNNGGNPIFTFEPGLYILVPALPDPDNLTAPIRLAPNLTLAAGQSLARKTSDGLGYPFNKVASDGTQTWIGFNEYAGSTDANGVFYPTSGISAGITYYATGLEYGQMYTSGVFSPLFPLSTAATGTAVAEVDTFTPATPTEGDVIGVYNANGVGIEIIVTATPSATTITTQLKNAWNANADCVAIAAATGTATFILTAATAGVALGLTGTIVGTGTFAKVVTTAPVAAQQSEVDTFTPSGAATADVFSLTIVRPGGSNTTVSFTVGGTTTAAVVSAGLIAAWNANTDCAQYATATGTATVILTGVVAGNTLNITGAVVGSGTLSKAVTKPALGANIADITPSRPGSYILQPYGYFKIV